MIWQAKFIRGEVEPGTTRTVEQFAWLPIYIAGRIVWLEIFEIIQGFVATPHEVLLDNVKTTFVVSKWINLAKRCKQ